MLYIKSSNNKPADLPWEVTRHRALALMRQSRVQGVPQPSPAGREILTNLELNENENTMYQKLWDAGLRGKSYTNEEEKAQNSKISFAPKKLGKEK